jgi:lysophospholipase L1-like esterase
MVAVSVSLLVAAASVVIATGTVTDTFSVVTPTRIMPLGDSITRGGGSSWGQGYRLPLMQMMVAGTYSSDIVGGQNSGPPWLYDRNHEGWGGYGIDGIASIVVSELNTYRPHFVLLMIGSNDVQWGTNLNTAPDRLSALIDLITDTLPTANLIVASITPLADPTWDAAARTYNAAIPGIVQIKAAAGKLVSFVDMYPLLTLSDLVDGVHPNDSGYNKLATAWAAKLVSLRPAPPPLSARSCPCSIWGAGDAPSVPNLASTTAAEVGVKFRTERDGFITAVRFYKAPNAGSYTVSLWEAIADSTTYTDNSTTISGTLLSQGTATSGSNSGWQEVSFGTPVHVSANKLYFASYYAPSGYYADSSYFRDHEILHSPLRLPSQGAVDGNGFINSNGAGLPWLPSPQNDTNYWVDVVFFPAVVPAAPSTVNATAISSSQINVAWSSTTDATGYRVERSTNQVSWLGVATTSATVTTDSDTGLSAATTYYYRVVATNPIGDSPPSAVASATTQPAPSPADTTAPTAPTALKAASPKNKVNLSWTGSTDTGGSGLAGYRIWRGTGGATGSFSAISTTAGTSYSDMNVMTKQAYWYRVTAFDLAGNESQPSNVVSASPK